MRAQLLTSALSGALLCLLLSACVITVRDDRVEGAPSEGPPRARGAGDEGSPAERVAALELELARAQAEAGLAEARAALEDARRDLEEAAEELERFQTLERPHETGEAALELHERGDDVAQAELKLAQMVADFERFGEEDYARMNRELVVGRSRFELEVARRRLALEEQAFALVTERELPARERRLARALDEKRRALERAELALGRAELEGRLAVLKAELEHDEAQGAREER